MSVFGVLHDFVKSFKDAVTENEKKEMRAAVEEAKAAEVEKKRRRVEQLQVARKSNQLLRVESGDWNIYAIA